MGYGIAPKVAHWGRLVANSFWGVSASGPKDRKKISYREMKKLCEQTACAFSIDSMQYLLALAKEIDGCQDAKNGQNKFDLLLGELEIFLTEYYDYYQKNWDGNRKMKSVDIMELKDRVKHWSVRCEYEEKNLQEKTQIAPC